MKTCRTCNFEQDILQFGEYTQRNGKKSRRNECNSCRRIREAKRYSENPEVRSKMKETAAAYHLLNRYGLTGSDFDKMVNDRENKCDICKGEMLKPNVDHCHSTGKVRGLLCWGCNTGLGKFKDNVEYLNNAILYLKGE